MKKKEKEKRKKKQCQEQFVLQQKVVLISRPNHTLSQLGLNVKLSLKELKTP